MKCTATATVHYMHPTVVFTIPLMPRSVEVTTPLRLHFGLFSFGGAGQQFGGVGAMAGLAGPRVRVTPAERLKTTGPLAIRARQFAERWSGSQGWKDLPACHIEVIDSPPEHAGLGVGTQLALAVATGLNVFFDRPIPSPAELAISVGRGLRSAVGTYGFAHGGLVVEQGKLPGEPISPLDCQLDIPAAWRFALIRPRASANLVAGGMAGPAELEAFAGLPAVPASVTQRLVAEVCERLVPAAAQERFDEFSESVYQFGREAGLCFAALQGGPYNGPLLVALVSAVRALGIRGVGQSSWGPTLFALLPGDAPFADFAARLRGQFPAADLSIELVPPNNRGATVISNC